VPVVLTGVDAGVSEGAAKFFVAHRSIPLWAVACVRAVRRCTEGGESRTPEKRMA
jgi:hypothetical protein